MKVALDVRLLGDPAFAERGIGRYTRSLLDAMIDAGRNVVALSHLERPRLPRRIAELSEHALLGRDARRAGAVVLHSPSIDLTTTRPGIPYVVTVHDLVPLKRPADYLRTGLKHRLRYEAVRRASRIITPTRFVARDCAQLLGIQTERIAVVPEAAAPVFRPIQDPREQLARFRLPDEFILWVGGLDPPDPRKGVRELADAARRRGGPPLVLAGRVSAEAAALAEAGRVLLIGRPSDSELAALYSAAEAVVVPSQEEGFGLPVLEALACGTPVAAFAIEALTELHDGNPAVRLVERGDFGALLSAAENLRGGVVVGALQRSWADVAAETWPVYELAASSA